jgi:hypothetical protein
MFSLDVAYITSWPRARKFMKKLYTSCNYVVAAVNAIIPLGVEPIKHKLEYTL